MNEGTDVTVLCTGHLVWKSIQAAEILASQGVSVELINIHTIKPLDEEAIVRSASKTRAVVTAEEHMIAGGLGESVAQVLARKLPTPIEFVAVNDSFGESGTPDELMAKYGLDSPHIVQAALKVISRK
jgi:transketolase